MQTKPKIIFFGSDSFVVQVLKGLEENFNVVAVVTTPNSPVANYFKGKTLTPKKLDFEFNYELRTVNCELFIVASYGKIIPQSTLDLPRYGALNIHPSLLPKHRGPSPVPTTILNGDKVTGVTIMKMDADLDHGPIIKAEQINLTGQEDLQELINKLFQLGIELLIEVIPDYIEGKIKLTSQNHEQATYTKHLTKEDGYFDLPAGGQVLTPSELEKLDRMIRAYYPWPGVWTKWNSKIVKFLPARNATHSVAGGPGGLIQMEGKKPMAMKDFLNGYPNFPIKFL